MGKDVPLVSVEQSAKAICFWTKYANEWQSPLGADIGFKTQKKT